MGHPRQGSALDVTVELVVGVTLPISGSLLTQGHEVRRGLELWSRGAEVEGRRRIHLRILDDGSSARRAGANAERLLEQEVDLLFGPYGGAAGRAVSELAGRPGVLIWNHSSSDDDVARPFVVTLPTPASKYLVGAVELAAEQGCLHALVAVSDTRFGVAVARGAERCATAREMDASVLYVAPGQWVTRRPEILSYAAQGSLVALCGALRDDIETVAALRDRGEGPSVIAAVGAGVHEFGRALGSRAEGVIGPSQWEPEDTSADVGPSSSRMVAAYRDLHGSSPDYLAVQAWSCGVLAEAALDQVGPEPEDLWSWAMRFDGRTAYGDFRLDSEGRQVGHRLRLVRWDARRNRKLLT
ncbi:MAG: ABC transporter substrate-binding protein [Actinomycetota bacterium]|nr:ABC transporter substrate-binding protein [Actinomycetota bacterium]